MSEGVSIYEIAQTDLPSDIGVTLYSYANGVFTKYAPPALEVAKKQKNEYLTYVNTTVEFLQNAVDLEEATDAEVALLKEWKKYRVALNRLDLSTAPDIDWPEKPDENQYIAH